MDRPSSDGDELLIQKCKEELPYVTKSFEQILRKHEPFVLKTCQYLLGDPYEAEEACQDIFLRVFNKIQTFQQKASFRTWLYRIAHNYCFTKRKQIINRSIARQKLTSNIKREHSINETFHSSNSSAPVIHEILHELSSQDRKIITLKFISGLTINEIAEENQVKLSTAKMRLYRALERFKVEYEKKFGKSQL